MGTLFLYFIYYYFFSFIYSFIFYYSILNKKSFYIHIHFNII